MVETEDYLRLAHAVNTEDDSVLPILADLLEEQGNDTSRLREVIALKKKPRKTSDTTDWWFWISSSSNLYRETLSQVISKDCFSVLQQYSRAYYISYHSSRFNAFIALVIQIPSMQPKDLP